MIDKIKLVICDIDSTLVTTVKRELTPKTKEVIDRLHAHGVYFGIASGRSVDQQLSKEAREWGFDYEFDVLIGMNGSELWDGINFKRYDYYKLKKEWIKEIIELMEPFNLNPFLYYKGKMLCLRLDDSTMKSSRKNRTDVIVAKDVSQMYAEDNAKIMFRTTEAQMPAIEAYVNQHPSPYYKAFKTQTTMLEFADKRVNKALALKHFCDINQIPAEQVMAFGDMNNDNEMIQYSGWGVCMINGSDETKAISKDITTKSNDEDGFAIYMEDNYLNKMGW